MKVEELKLYNKYKHINNPDREFIYIGVDNDCDYWFLFKKSNHLSFSSLKDYGFNPSQIVKDLNLEILKLFTYGDKYIKGYYYIFYSKVGVEEFFKPILKDKLNNIINR